MELIKKINDAQKKDSMVEVQSGDRVKVHQKIKEGDKERVQAFEGVVVRVDRKNSASARITVRKTSSGVGVEKGFLIHSPLVEKIEVVRRSKVRRNYISYMRDRSGKGERLKGVAFDHEAVNAPTAKAKPTEDKETKTD